jgi:putative ABC transport system substrate-binding protein
VRRRDFITALGSAAVWPLAARAQQRAQPVIGFLHTGSPEASENLVAAFRKGLSESGYVDGRNVAIEYRWAHNEMQRLPELAADLVHRQVAVISITGAMASALAAKAATTTIPIVFGTGADPVQAGLVASLNRPRGNITGINYMGVELGGKRLGLLHELLPAATRFAVLVNRNSPNLEFVISDARTAASAIGREMEVLYAANATEIDIAFAGLGQSRIDALLVSPSPLFTSRRAQLVTLAARYAMPAIYETREFAEAVGLMYYGPDSVDEARQVGIYTSYAGIWVTTFD